MKIRELKTLLRKDKIFFEYVFGFTLEDINNQAIADYVHFILIRLMNYGEWYKFAKWYPKSSEFYEKYKTAINNYLDKEFYPEQLCRVLDFLSAKELGNSEYIKKNLVLLYIKTRFLEIHENL